MEHDCDIAIVGGGLNGPALALAAAQVGLRVIVLDATSHKPRKNAKFDGRAYALALASKRLMAAVGVWENVAQDAEPMLNIRVSDGRAGVGASPFFMDFDHAELEEGPMGYMVEDRHLRYALQAAMQTSPLIEYRLATRVTGQSTGPEGVTLSLANNQKITTRLLVGADGRQSGTAARAGITYTGWQYGQTALVCAVEHDRPHGGVAHQFFMPAGPMAVLPLSARRSTVVWSEKTDSAAVIKTLDDAAFLDVLRPRFGDFLGDIALTGGRFSYPLGMMIAKSYIAPNVALIGDAAHGVHPIAGQGLNAGLRDVAALIQVLSEAKQRGEDFASQPVLARYQLWRRFDATALAVATDGFNRLFSNDNPILRLGRDLGMGMLNAMPKVRRGILREAAGLTGDLPDLMRE
ncbi:MAG: UbiH/UbiF/VisC/COQ6 family ubiquinone biosynthesis hydroxylase [Marinovum sp.]|jgi:2-octaprenyl-6-methoxyphenol hydroxylase|nr:UbiH/UbiF/VisC/COQ6 family ubiquinone biosynthesis hydroxylase [Marinovum sp.]